MSTKKKAQKKQKWTATGVFSVISIVLLLAMAFLLAINLGKTPTTQTSSAPYISRTIQNTTVIDLASNGLVAYVPYGEIWELQQVNILQIENGNEIVIATPGLEPSLLKFSPDGSMLAVLFHQYDFNRNTTAIALCAYNTVTGQKLNCSPDTSILDSVRNSLVWSRPSWVAYTGLYQDTGGQGVRMWDVESNQTTNWVAPGPEQSIKVIGMYQGPVYMVSDLETGKYMISHNWDTPYRKLSDYAVASGQYVAYTADNDGFFVLGNSANGRPLSVENPEIEGVAPIFSLDTNELAFLRNGMLLILDIESGESTTVTATNDPIGFNLSDKYLVLQDFDANAGRYNAIVYKR